MHVRAIDLAGMHVFHECSGRGPADLPAVTGCISTCVSQRTYTLPRLRELSTMSPPWVHAAAAATAPMHAAPLHYKHQSNSTHPANSISRRHILHCSCHPRPLYATPSPHTPLPLAQYMPVQPKHNCCALNRLHLCAGHDWGAAIATDFAAMYPKKVSHLALLAVPPGKLFFQNMDLHQLSKSAYMWRFLVPNVMEAIMSANDWAAVRVALTKPAAGGLLRRRMGAEELGYMLDAIATPGASKSGMNYYRCGSCGLREM